MRPTLSSPVFHLTFHFGDGLGAPSAHASRGRRCVIIPVDVVFPSDTARLCVCSWVTCSRGHRTYGSIFIFITHLL